MSAEDLDAVVEHCRRRRVWIVADDVYSRLHYGHFHAPNVLTRTEPDDGAEEQPGLWRCPQWPLPISRRPMFLTCCDGT